MTFAVETKTSIFGVRRLRVMAYRGIPYTTDQNTGEIRFDSRDAAQSCADRIKRLAGQEAWVVEA